MSDILVLQHIHCETLGTIAEALDTKGLSYQYIRAYKGEPIPKTLGEAKGLVIMGGPMGVYEEKKHPFLRDEMRLIENTLKEEKPILGTCLGSQLLAHALKSQVTRGKQKEIGWYPVTLTQEAKSDPLLSEAPESLEAIHWHGDIFDLPQNAVRLASSELTETQGFRYKKNAYGFLFHMEVTPNIISNWTQEFAEELQEENLEGQKILAEKEKFQSINRVGKTVYSQWAELL